MGRIFMTRRADEELDEDCIVPTFKQSPVDMPGIRLPIDFAIFYQISHSTSSTEGYSWGFTLIAKYYIENKKNEYNTKKGLRDDI